MKSTRVGLLAIALTASVLGRGLAAATPFDGTDWLAVVSADPSLHEDADLTKSLGKPYFERRGGFMVSSDTVIGRAGGEWIAAVPLDTGGTIGIGEWLLYLPHEKTHFATVEGSEGLSFEHGKIVTISEVGGRALNHGVEHTFSVRGRHVALAGSRKVSLGSP